MRRAPVSAQWLEEARKNDEATPILEATAHYLRDVLRLGPGAQVELFDGTGVVATVCLVLTEAGLLGAKIIEVEMTVRGESPCAITLYQAIPKGDRWTWVLEKATELGIARIVPLKTARSVVEVPRGKEEGKLSRWRSIVAAAARQSQRDIIPEVLSQLDLKTALKERTADPRFVLNVDGGTPSLVSRLQELSIDGNPSSLGLFVGPEGGFTATEIDAFDRAGVLPCSLGPRVLRSETAGVVTIALAQSIVGDLG